MNTTPNKIPVERSSFVTGLGWTSAVLSGLATLMAIAQMMLIDSMLEVDQMEAAMRSVNPQQMMPPAAEFIADHFQLLSGAFLVLSVITLISSIGLLNRKNWARLIFIFLMALGILWNLGGLFLQQDMFTSIPSTATEAFPEIQSQFESITHTVMIFSVIMAIGASIVLAWIIKRLASKQVRQEFGVAP